MHFTRLKLTGFKSFVDPAELLIEPGLTGIVGPNGCGKSNLVEALQWAMGEASARRLRGAEMDDVIFAGSGIRPPRNIASVALMLALSEEQRPAWFAGVPSLAGATEIDVERRIDRGRGSAYRVNGCEVRARDVQTLFADAASGAGSAALVGQGRISWLISARPSERRTLLEEAAGIAGLQSRRHEAELKLAATEQNLLRVDDNTASLTQQIEKLKRQARQAARYRDLSDQIRLAEAQALLRRDAEALTRLRGAEAGLQQAVAAAEQREAEAKAAQCARDEEVERLDRARETVQQGRQVIETLKTLLREIAAEDQRVGQRLADLAHRLEELKQDEAREGQSTAELATLGTKYRAEHDQLREAQIDSAALDQARQRAAAAGEAVGQAEAALREAVSLAAQRQAERGAAERRLASLRDRYNRLLHQHAELTAQAGTRDLLSISEEQRKAAAAATKAAEEATESARRRLETADEALRAARQAESESLAALRVVQHRRLELDAEIKGLQRLAASEAINGFPPILDQLRVEPGLEAVIGAAFKEDLSASLADEAPLWWTLLETDCEPAALPDSALPFSSFVTAPPQLARRLAYTGLVEDDATGAAMHARLRPGQSLVARSGTVWRWDGLVRRAQAPTASAARLIARNRLFEATSELADVARQARLAEECHHNAKQGLDQAAMEERAARDGLRQTEPQIARMRAAEAALAQQAAAIEQKQRDFASRMLRVEQELAEFVSQLQEGERELALLPAADQDRDRLLRLTAAVEDTKQHDHLCRREADGLDRDRLQREQRLEQLDQELKALDLRAQSARQQAERLVGRRAKLEQDRAALESRPLELQAQRQAETLRLGEAVKRADADKASLQAAEAEVRGRDAAMSRLAESLTQAREDKIRREAAVDQAREAARAVQMRIVECFDCSPAILQRKLADEHPGLSDRQDAAELEEIVARLKRDRDQIGAVNLVAETELAELTAVFEAADREAADLKIAVGRLRQSIRDLNEEGRAKLVAAFDRVNAHFQELFTRLFAGGRASLELIGAEQDPLQAGLEITASPPGKRSQILSLLSGGERALTAVALVFAMFLTNPAPICVLDEVDAPLDDANVERFCTMVRDIGARTGTRFLIITHHRVTMARMDRLYGVTMMEKGVSQLVSVALNDADMMRETA